jgi:hypothetical protein
VHCNLVGSDSEPNKNKPYSLINIYECIKLVKLKNVNNTGF